jgi:hypothetical protein
MFISIDRWLGEFMKLMKKEDTLVFVSDRGFQNVFGTFYMGEWLRQKGHIKEDSLFKARIKKTAIYSEYKLFTEKIINRPSYSAGKHNIISSKNRQENIKRKGSHVDICSTTGDHLWLKIKDGDGKNTSNFCGKVLSDLGVLKELGTVKAIYDVNGLYGSEYTKNLNVDKKGFN